MPSPDRTQWTDPRWCDAQYNNRTLVANSADFIARWPQWAAAVRARLPHRPNIPYGPHPREVLDIFPADNAKGTLLFIHGGYWRALSKNDMSWIAETFVDAGYSVALINYPLTPEVSVGTIIECCKSAIVKVWGELNDRERANVLVAGHSVGGHLVAEAFTTDWRARGLPASPFTGGLPISGVFELAPLVHTSMNAEIRLTPETAIAWSVDQKMPRVAAPLILTVGGVEFPEFLRQTADQTARWQDVGASSVVIPGRNHFDILEELRDPASALFACAMKLLAKA